MSMSASEMGKRGAATVNKMLTKEKRSKAAKKGWRLRKRKLQEPLTDKKTKNAK